MRYDELEHTPEYRLVKTHVVEGVDPAETMSSELRGFLEKAREYYADLLGRQELKSLTMALEGKYIPTSTGRGPINNPESLPTGLYRDAFPNVMTLISKAIEQVARLQEEDNFVAQHSARIEQDLLASGIEPEEAETLSTIRFFSNERGEYGSGLETASLASDTWETDEKLANLYLDRMGHIYGPDERTWEKKLPDIDLYGKNLSGTDVALFSRSSTVADGCAANNDR